MIKNAVLALAAWTALGAAAQAQSTYPTQPVTVVVPFAAGGASDVLARVVVEAMSRDLGQRVLVQNIGGAGGTVRRVPAGAGRVCAGTFDRIHRAARRVEDLVARGTAARALPAARWGGFVLKKWFIPVALLAMAACDQEAPTEIGAGLLPPGAVRTFEVTLPPERYLVRDTAFGLYTDPRDVPFVVVARDFDGALTSHALVRFSRPENLTVTDTAGSIRIDTVPNWFAGTIRMAVDSAFIPTQALQFAVYRTTEAWHESATWSLRGDTAGAERLFRRILDGSNWAAFGYIAAEAELAQPHREQPRDGQGAGR